MRHSIKKVDYSIITELPETEVPCEQLERFYQRYRFALEYVHGGRVLEIGCGGGQGLGLFKTQARQVFGIDLEDENIKIARQPYSDIPGIHILQMDAHDLAFPDGVFGLIVTFEAIYYFKDVSKVIAECKRLLAPGGMLVIGSVNREWRDFNPSPYSIRYYSLKEIHDILAEEGFQVDVYSSYHIPINRSAKDRALSAIKRRAVRLGIMPKSMKIKKYFKRFAFGKLTVLPAVLGESSCSFVAPIKVDPFCYETQFKVMYAVAKKMDTANG